VFLLHVIELLSESAFDEKRASEITRPEPYQRILQDSGKKNEIQ